MPEIVITIRNKIATASVRSIVCDNTDYTVRLDCDAQWSAGPKIVYFVLQGVGALAPATTADDVCAVPPIHLSDGVGRQLAIGVQQGAVKTSSAAHVFCWPSAENELIQGIIEDDDITLTWLEWVNANMAQAALNVETAQTILAQAQAAADSARGSANDAAIDAADAGESFMMAARMRDAAIDASRDAEAWAKGTRNGEDVESDDPAYHSNAKYNSQQASGAEAAAETARGGAEAAQTAAESAKAGAQAAQTAAAESAQSAGASAASAGSSAQTAEAAKTAAETAQGKAEDAQEAAEAAAEDIAESAEQIETNKEDISELKTQMDTLIPIDLAEGVAVTNGQYINYSTGAEGSSSSAFCTAMIDVSAYSKIVYSRYYTTSTTSSWGIAFYDSNGTYVPNSGIRASLGSGDAHYELETADVPSDAKYVRLSGNQTLGPVSLYNEADYDSKVYPRLQNAENQLGHVLNEIQPIVDKDVLVSSVKDGTESSVYLMDGTTTTNSSYRSTDYIDVSEYSRLEYKLGGSTSTTPDMSLLTFFDSNHTFVYSVGAIINNSSVESDIPVPDDAKYVVALIRTDGGFTPYVHGVKKESLQNDIHVIDTDKFADLEDVSFDVIFDDPVCYENDGDRISGGNSAPYRRMSRYINCESYHTIKYGLIGLTGQKMLIFYDKDLDPVGYVPGSGTNTYNEGETAVPQNAKYVSGAWLSSKSDKPYIIGSNENTTIRVDNLYSIGNISPAYTNAVVTEDMTLDQFITACNNARSSWAELNLCATSCFRTLTGVSTFDAAYNRLNKNFRQDVCVPGISKKLLYDRINAAFETRIRRFEDAKLNLTTSCDFSVQVGESQGGEPSAIVSADGGELWVYSYSKRLKSTDGITWSEPESTTITGDTARTPQHKGLSVVDDTIFMFGRDPDGDHNLKMYTSPLSDGLNFTYRGVPLPIGYNFGDGLEIDNWGNSFLMKEGDTYYLYIEGRQNVDGNFWDTYLVTCTDPFYDNGDGTVGNWQNCGVAPVIQARSLFGTSNSIAFGNPDLAVGPDNRPIKVDGKFFMYFHSTAGDYSYLCRAYSYDLINWTPEHRLFDNRNRPTAGENQSSNADQFLIEFKGRTYLFYTKDINTTLTPHLMLMIDDRPFRELLKMYP